MTLLRSKGFMFLDTKRVCDICDTNKTHVDKHGYERWRDYNGKRYCSKCYGTLVSKQDPAYIARQYYFLEKRLFDDKKIRTGICSECHKKIGDIYTGWQNKLITLKQTQLHHEFYLTICPWFSRRELCVACHNKIRWRLWRERQKNILKQVHHCSLCNGTDSISKYWYFGKGKSKSKTNENRLCRRCWQSTVYRPMIKYRKKP